MPTNQESIKRQEEGKVEYEWGTLWPHYHKEKMNWATGFRTKGDVDILFLSGSTGRDPFADAPNRTPEEERAGRGTVVGTHRRNHKRLGAVVAEPIARRLGDLGNIGDPAASGGDRHLAPRHRD